MQLSRATSRRFVWVILALICSISVSLMVLWAISRPRPGLVRAIPPEPKVTGATVARVWPGNPQDTHMQAVSDDFTRYATTDRDGTIHVRNVADDSEVALLPGAGTSVEWVLRFSPDGRWLGAAYGSTRRFVLWDLADARPVWTNEVQYFAADFSSDGRSLALAVARQVTFFDLATLKSSRTVRTDLMPHSISFSPDARLLAVTTITRPAVEFIDTDSGQCEFSWTPPGVIRSPAWSPDGKQFAAPAANGDVLFLDTGTWTVVRTLPAHKGVVTHARYSPDGRILATAGWDKRVRLWRMEEDEPFFTESGEPPALKFSTDGKQLGLLKSGRDLTILELVMK